MQRFDGKTAIVSGGARGIGAATVRILAREGARVVISDLLSEEGGALAAELGDAAIFIEHDVRDQRAWDAVVAAAVEQFGAVSILVNNAGVATFETPVQSCSEEEYRRVIDINQLGVFLGMRSVIPHMKAGGGGSIVNVSSIAGLVGAPGMLPYVASKFAVTGMTKAAAIDLAPLGIRVNSIHPGQIVTPIFDDAPKAIMDGFEQYATAIPMMRMGAADELAKLIAFVASDDASFSTGAAFTADGGWTAA